LDDPKLCEPALAILSASQIRGYDKMIAERLSDRETDCAAGIMDVLSNWNPDLATEDIIYWYRNGTQEEISAALKVLGRSSSAIALKELYSAAEAAEYRWEPTGAMVALLDYAENSAKRGELETLTEVCDRVMRMSILPNSVQYRTIALSLLVKYKGLGSFDRLKEAFVSNDIRYRIAAFEFAKGVPGSVATRRYLSILGGLPDNVKVDMITMLGDRGDAVATEAVVKSLFGPSMSVRVSSAKALAKLKGTDSADDLITYIKSFPDIEDQRAGLLALTLISDSKRREIMSHEIDGSPDITKSNLITVISLGGESSYFNQIASYCESSNSTLRASAFQALPRIAGPENTEKLVEMVNRSSNKSETIYLQQAIAGSILRAPNRSTAVLPLLEALNSSTDKSRFIPILPLVGGDQALNALAGMFDKGTVELREICFDALVLWPDINVVYKLYSIASSGNKSYETRAFDTYLNTVSESKITPELRLLLFRKVMPLAKTDIQKREVISRLAGNRTYHTFVYLSGFLDNPATSEIAAKSLISISMRLRDEDTSFYGDSILRVLEQVREVISAGSDEGLKTRIDQIISEMPQEKGFESMFNGKNLSGWQGLVENPIVRAGMSERELVSKQKIANEEMTKNWSVKDGALYFSGAGANLCSIKEYGDFEMLVDWLITKKGDSGIYLRGTPQVQIWDTSRVEVGAQVGSGGLYNNSHHKSIPLTVADNPVGEWNTLRIVMKGERVSVWLNGLLVVDNVIMENYWDRTIPIFPTGPIELQAHGNELAFRDIFIREISSEDVGLSLDEKTEGFISLFNGKDLDNWIGNKKAYTVDDRMIVVVPDEGSGGNLYTEKEYSDFNFRFEFQLTPGANNGLGIRAPLEGDAAYVGMELQILDNSADIYANLEPYQYHGSVYGVIPARRGFLNPVGEWNSEEVIVKGTHITVILNGNIIVDGDIADARDNGTMDHNEHPGLKRKSGHIGFLGHGSELRFRNIRIKEL
jgi:HEAT repeat protein